jgi:hypothetical protein
MDLHDLPFNAFHYQARQIQELEESKANDANSADVMKNVKEYEQKLAMSANTLRLLEDRLKEKEVRGSSNMC